MFFKRKKTQNNATDDARNKNGATPNSADPQPDSPARHERAETSGMQDTANAETVSTQAPAAQNAARPECETAGGASEGRGPALITLFAIIMTLALLALFTAFMPHRPLWLTQEPQILATAESGAWLPGAPAITPYPLFNWLVIGIENLCRNSLNLTPGAVLPATAYVCMAVFLLSALSLSKATGQPRKTGMAAALALFSMGPLAGLAWFARPEPLFAGLLTLAFGAFFWAAKRPKAPISMILAAVAATLALFCGGIWGAILPVAGLVLYCLLGLRPRRLLAMDAAIAIGIIIAVPLIFGAGLMLFADNGAAESFFSALGQSFFRTIMVPGGLAALWRTPLLLICLSLPWIAGAAFLTPHRSRCWLSTLPLWLMLICLGVWSGLRVSGDPVRDLLIALPALPPLAVILARWVMLLPQPRIGLFTRLAGIILFLSGLAAVAAAIVHAASLTSIEALLPVHAPEFLPFWAILVPGIIAIAAGAAIWSVARRVAELKAVAAIAIAILITGQAVGQFFLPQIAPRFTFSVIGPAIQAYARDGIPAIAVGMPPNSLYVWSSNVIYVESPDERPKDPASCILIMPRRVWDLYAMTLPPANIVTQTVGREQYVLAPMLAQRFEPDFPKTNHTDDAAAPSPNATPQNEKTHDADAAMKPDSTEGQPDAGQTEKGADETQPGDLYDTAAPFSGDAASSENNAPGPNESGADSGADAPDAGQPPMPEESLQNDEAFF